MRTLHSLTQEELLDRTKSLVAEERKINLELIEHLREIERRFLYLEMGYQSLWDFVVRHLGLSEGAAQRRIQAMRLTRENPEVKEALANGSLTLTTAAQLQTFFQAEKKQGKKYSEEAKKEIIESIQGLTKRECEKKLCAISPHAIPKEQEKSVSPNEVELKLVLDTALIEKLKYLKDLLGHKIPQASYLELIRYLADLGVAHLEKKKVGVIRDNKNAQASSSTSPEMLRLKKQSRPYIPLQVRQKIWQRAKGRCEFISHSGLRCNSRRSLEVEHQIL